MKDAIFLSASVPDPKQNAVYHQTADVTAIREAVIALATYILPQTTLIWGGHPAITPMIRVVAESIGVSVQEKIILYQSSFFEKDFPIDNKVFEQINLIQKRDTRDESLEIMRGEMLSNHSYKAAVFIGGMKGVEDEFYLFKKYHPDTSAFPIASTGAAARVLYERNRESLPESLNDEYSYFSLFRRLISFK
ncbi:SLOG domain-containing protein [Spirosoma rhododendri]|nr:hypothetical protein [Spirosoma rhododendri]